MGKAGNVGGFRRSIRQERSAKGASAFDKTGANGCPVFWSAEGSQLNDIDPFDYLTELQRHAEDLAAQPERWMPWNYRESLTSIRGN